MLSASTSAQAASVAVAPAPACVAEASQVASPVTKRRKTGKQGKTLVDVLQTCGGEPTGEAAVDLGGGTNLCGPVALLGLFPAQHDLREAVRRKGSGPFTYREMFSLAKGLTFSPFSALQDLTNGAYLLHESHPGRFGHVTGLRVEDGEGIFFDATMSQPVKISLASLPARFHAKCKMFSVSEEIDRVEEGALC